MKIFERHELLLKELHESFGSSPFGVKDIYPLKVQEIRAGLEAVFGKSVLSLKGNLIRPKIGRLFEQKLSGQKIGPFQLQFIGRRDDANVYKILGPPIVRAAPPKPDVLTSVRIDRDGRVHTETLLDKTGEPVKAQPTAPAAPPPKPAPPPPPARIPKICEGGKWREMTMQEYEASTLGQRILQAAAVHDVRIPMIRGQPIDPGFDDPGGVVTLARTTEHNSQNSRRWSQDL